MNEFVCYNTGVGWSAFTQRVILAEVLTFQWNMRQASYILSEDSFVLQNTIQLYFSIQMTKVVRS